MAKNKSPRGTALVTGGSKRIGQAIVLTLAAMGYNIALHYHQSKNDARGTASLIKKKGVACEIFACDLAREPAVLALVKSVKAKFPDLNVLINNASIFEPSRLNVQGLRTLDRHFAINLKAPFILTSEFARVCRKGNIINLLDTNIAKHKTTHFTYLLTKKSLADLTKMSAVALGPRIRVNGICPGLILPAHNESEDTLDRMARNIPLKRKGNIKNITQSVRFLLENDYLTGHFIFNNGGEHLI